MTRLSTTWDEDLDFDPNDLYTTNDVVKDSTPSAFLRFGLLLMVVGLVTFWALTVPKANIQSSESHTHSFQHSLSVFPPSESATSANTHDILPWMPQRFLHSLGPTAQLMPE